MKTVVNTERLKELAKALEERAAQPRIPDAPLPTPLPYFRMSRYIDGNTNSPICHTAGCIAGTAVALYDLDTYRQALERQEPEQLIKNRATVLLGLTEAKATALFQPPSVAISDIDVGQAIDMLIWLAAHPGVGPRRIENHWLSMVGEEVF